MATSIVPGPNGEDIKVEHDENATDAEIVALAKQQHAQWGDLPGNIPSSLYNQGADLVGGIGQMLSHPIDTAQSILKTGSGAIQSIPGVGDAFNAVFEPLGVEEADTQYSDAMGKALFTDPYGSMEKAKNTLITDPARPFGDAATVLSGGSLAPVKGAATMGKVASMIDPLSVVAKGALAGGKAAGITPGKLWESATKLPPSTDSKTRQRMTQTALDEGIEPTYDGVTKINDIIAESGGKLDEIIGTATGTGTTMPKNTILANAKQMLDDFDPVTAGDDYLKVKKQIQDTIKRQAEVWKDTDQLTPEQVLKFKREMDKKVNYSAASRTGAGFKPGVEQTRKNMADTARGQLEELDPEVGPLNERMSNMFELRDKGLENAAGRIENRDIFSLTNLMMTGIGTAAGVSLGIGEGILSAAVTKLITDPRTKAKAAIKMHQGMERLKTSPLAKHYIVNNTLTRQGAIQLERMMTEQGALAEEE